MKTEPLPKYSRERIEYLYNAWNTRIDTVYDRKDVTISIKGQVRVFPSIGSTMEELDNYLFRRVDSHICEAKILQDKLEFLNAIGADIILEDYEINLLSIVKELDNKVRLFLIDHKLR